MFEQSVCEFRSDIRPFATRRVERPTGALVQYAYIDARKLARAILDILSYLFWRCVAARRNTIHRGCYWHHLIEFRLRAPTGYDSQA